MGTSFSVRHTQVTVTVPVNSLISSNTFGNKVGLGGEQHKEPREMENVAKSGHESECLRRKMNFKKMKKKKSNKNLIFVGISESSENGRVASPPSNVFIDVPEINAQSKANTITGGQKEQPGLNNKNKRGKK